MLRLRVRNQSFFDCKWQWLALDPVSEDRDT
jgi:hypothetical protein